jgi:uncharacterized protein YhfF
VTDGQIDAFWSVARRHARTDRLFADIAAFDDEARTPPVSALGATPTEADALLALVLDGTKTATAGALWDYEHEGETLPKIGDLAILLDGARRPRGLIEVTQVEVVPYDQVSKEHARLEGEGDLSLAYWRDVHERFFAEVATHGRVFVRTMPVVIQTFRLLYSQ